MRSIWEEAFTIPGVDADLASRQSEAEVGVGAMASTSQSSTPAGQAPATLPQWASPRPSAPSTPPADELVVERKGRFVGVTPVELAGDRGDAEIAFDPTPSRFRNAKWIGAFGGVAIGGLLVALLGLRASPSPPSSAAPEVKRARPFAVAPVVPVAPPTSTVITPPPSTPLAAHRLPETYKISVSVVPETATIDLDGASAGQGHVERSLPIDHARHTLRFSASGFDDRTLEFIDAAPPGQVILVRRSRSEPARAAVAPVTPRPKRMHAPEAAPHNLNPNGAPVID